MVGIVAGLIILVLAGCGGGGGGEASNPGQPVPEVLSVTDVASGLTWQYKDDGNTRNHADAEAYCSGLDIPLSGGGVWRLPTVHDLATLYSFGENEHVLRNDLLPEINTTTRYVSFWTVDVDRSWSQLRFLDVDFSVGYIYSDYDETTKRALCVSGPKTKYGPLLDGGDGTILDAKSGLMWQKSDGGLQYPWQEAISACVQATTGGFNGWRVPTFQEMLTIIDYGFSSPACNSTMFPDADAWPAAKTYWTATEAFTFLEPSDRTDAWHFRFESGTATHSLKTTERHVRCVRTGNP